MATWKYTIREESTFYIDLDTTDEDVAFEQIREMFATGELVYTKSDYYEVEEDLEEA